MTQVSTSLWFENRAEEAARFYVSLFADGEIGSIQRLAAEAPGGGKPGDVISVSFTLSGTPYTAINGGDYFRLTPAASIVVTSDDQAELDRLWEALLEGGGKPMMCSWLTDRFGLTWQLVPKALFARLADPDREAVARMSQAMYTMQKIDMAALEAAFRGD